MVIKHFGILAGYALWTYILLCMFLTVLTELHHRRWVRQCKRKITAFLSPQISQYAHPRKLKQLLRLSRDHELFDHLCLCYSSGRDKYDPASAAALEHTMQLVFQKRIQKAARAGVLTRCLIVRNIRRCNITSDAICAFLRTCSQAAPLEQFWAQSGAETTITQDDKVYVP